jgi:hypothetical protein
MMQCIPKNQAHNSFYIWLNYCKTIKKPILTYDKAWEGATLDTLRNKLLHMTLKSLKFVNNNYFNSKVLSEWSWVFLNTRFIYSK